MINKKSLWFLTLFSLILVLSIYYVTMPSELLLNTKNNQNEEKKETGKEVSSPKVDIKESAILVALRVEAEEQMLNSLKELKGILTNEKSTIEQKNTAFEKMQSLNIIRGEEEKLEKIIFEKYQVKAFAKVTGDQIRIVVSKGEHNVELANNIMRTVQENYKNKMYISVQFQK